jgi:hypothetical protein
MEEQNVSRTERTETEGTEVAAQQHMATQPDIQTIRRMLGEIVRIAKDASLTGALAGSASLAVQQYNRTLSNLERSGRVPEGWFQTLAEGSTLDEAGFMARQLDSFLEVEMQSEQETQQEPANRQNAKAASMKNSSHADPDDPIKINHIVGLAPFMEQALLVELLRVCFRNNQTIDSGSLVGLAPFIAKEELSRIIREHLLSWTNQEITTQENAAQQAQADTGAQNQRQELEKQRLELEKQRAALGEQLARLDHELSSEAITAADNNRQTRPL